MWVWVSFRGGPKEGIDGGADAVLAGPIYDTEAALGKKQMTVGRRHVDAPALKRHVVLSEDGGQRPLLIQNLTQQCIRVRRRMLHDEHRRRQIGGELRDECLQRLNASH